MLTRRAIGKSTKWGMMQDLGRYGVETLTSATVVEITPAGLKLEQNGEIKEIRADTVVMAAGSAPHNPLEPRLKEMGIDYRTAGDVRQAGTAFDAVHQGYEAGMEI